MGRLELRLLSQRTCKAEKLDGEVLKVPLAPALEVLKVPLSVLMATSLSSRSARFDPPGMCYNLRSATDVDSGPE